MTVIEEGRKMENRRGRKMAVIKEERKMETRREEEDGGY